MQDRFRFRVLDTTNNKLYNSLEDLSKEEENAHFLLAQDGAIIKKYYNNGEIQLIRMSQYQPVFCTGLRDKNGKLIYEGDILEGYQTLEVSPLNSKMVLKRGLVRIPDGMFVATCHDIKENCTLFTQLHWSTTKVIGNVYQNPELLEDK